MTTTYSLAVAVAFTSLLLVPAPALAHCDTLDGPVVTSARQALAAGNVSLALIWVREEDEPEIREAFRHARAVRGLGGEAAALADRYFFETLVRVHRSGEGAPYTGLKPARSDTGGAIAAADRALATGTRDALLAVLTQAVADGIGGRFEAAIAAKAAARDGDVAAGRRFVAHYVDLIHAVERIANAVAPPAAGNGHQPDEHAGH